MKKILGIMVLGLLWCNTAFTESTLPPCQGEDHMQWTNCLGIYTNSDGNKYVGEFKDGEYHGQGTFTFPDGAKFVGEFKDGDFNGQGTLIFPEGEKYVGEFKDWDFNGQGTFTWPDGKKYVGEFKDGDFHGQGTYTWPDGKKYVGEFKDGKENGQGTYTWPDGEKEVALYKDGEIVKIISSTIRKESPSTSSSSSTFSSSTLSGYDHCKSVWRKLIDIRNRYSKNSPNYYRLDALVQTVFDLWTGYKGTNAKDTGNCDRLLSLGNN